MRYSDAGPRSISTWGLAMAALAAVAGCTPDPSPVEPEPPPAISPSPTPVPWSQEVRYHAIGSALCDKMDWDGLSSEVGMALEDLQFDGSTGEYITDALCDFHLDESTGLEDTFSGIWAFVYRDPERAYRGYRNEVESAETETSRWPIVVETIDGWWDGGAYLEQYREAGYVKPLLDVQYHLYHANLYIWAWFRGQVASPDLAQTDALAIGHDLSEALIEEAIGLVPCEALGDAPTPTHCDDMG